MKKTMIKSVISIAMIFVMMLTLTACGDGGPVVYDAPEGAPYEGYYEMDRMNSNFSYKYSKNKHDFNVTMKWRTEDENIVSAKYTDEFFLEWSTEESAFYSLCEPVNDMADLRKNTYTIKPGEDQDVNFDVDSYFDGLPRGYYRFVKVFDVKYKDGSVEKMVASFSCDLSD